MTLVIVLSFKELRIIDNLVSAVICNNISHLNSNCLRRTVIENLGYHQALLGVFGNRLLLIFFKLGCGGEELGAAATR